MMADSVVASSQNVLSLENLRRMAESISSSTTVGDSPTPPLLPDTPHHNNSPAILTSNTAANNSAIIEEGVKKSVADDNRLYRGGPRLVIEPAAMNGLPSVESQAPSSDDSDDHYVYEDDDFEDDDDDESQGNDVIHGNSNTSYNGGDAARFKSPDSNDAGLGNNKNLLFNPSPTVGYVNNVHPSNNDGTTTAATNVVVSGVNSDQQQQSAATSVSNSNTCPAATSRNTANNSSANSKYSAAIGAADDNSNSLCETNNKKTSQDKNEESEIICSECGTEFTDVQSYMSHGCIQQSSEESNDAARNPSFKPKCNDHEMSSGHMEVDDFPSDAESFDGKIVYNPDGSAYIIEGTSDMSDTESLLDVPNKEGVIIDQKGKVNSSQVPSFPQIANAYYIQKNPAFYNAWYSMLPPENRPRTEAPIMHSYRVFDVRTMKNNGNSEDSDPPRATKAVDLKSGDITSVPTKPILMCFICKLSFGYTKSFVSHSLTEHSMRLNEEEKCYLSRKNASAIIQGIGKSKSPLMSFLEPVSPSLHKKDGSAATFIPPNIISAKLKGSNSTNVSFVYSGSKVTPVEQKPLDSTSSLSLGNLHHQPTTAVMTSRHASDGSDPLSFIKQPQGIQHVDCDNEEDYMDEEDEAEESLSYQDNLQSSGSSYSLKSPLSRISSGGDNSNISPVKRDVYPSRSHHLSPSNAVSPGSSSGPPPLTSPQPGLSSTPTSLSPKLSLPSLPVPPLVPVTSATVNPNAPVQGIVIRAGCEDHPNGNITGKLYAIFIFCSSLNH